MKNRILTIFRIAFVAGLVLFCYAVCWDIPKMRVAITVISLACLMEKIDKALVSAYFWLVWFKNNHLMWLLLLLAFTACGPDTKNGPGWRHETEFTPEQRDRMKEFWTTPIESDKKHTIIQLNPI